VALLIGDPELIEYRGVRELAQPAIDLLRREAGLLRGVDEMSDDPRLRHHLDAEHLLHLVRDLVGETGAPGKQIGDHLARVLGRGQQRIARVPCKQRRDDDDGAGEQSSHE